MTTIEFCETSVGPATKKYNRYSQGFTENLMAVLGPKFYLWFLPLSLPKGDGLHFVVSDTEADRAD
eukprot:CAMPEP_0117555570 /NCGR_PEP_ID=MMETSP0784-20121206/51342_1 /TAXON_ID=39447 /ORGANISM="" /LENGTH=65 /DNA_ID=CAMNT_0005352779 /DNA_START=674 /DNA_END=871 /DNA_ORIENTATION=-